MTYKNASESAKNRGEWYKSSYSNSAGGSCVEVKHGRGAVFVRDSKDRRPDQPVIGMSAGGWNAFIDALTDPPA